MNFKEHLVETIRDMIAKGYVLKFVGNEKYNGLTISSIYLENCLISVFFKEKDCEYLCNSDWFVDALLQGNFVSAKEYYKTEVYSNY